MRLSLSVAFVALTVQAASAQSGTPSGPALSLDDAIALARRNNPGYLTQVNARRTAQSQLRATYGQLLPHSTASYSGGYQQGGTQIINGLEFSGASDAIQSSYSLGLSYSINVGAVVAPKLQRANGRAVESDIANNDAAMRAAVTQAYLVALQAEALASLQDTLVLQAQLQLDLAKAKMAVGSGTNLDVKQAEVGLSTAQVNAITARTNVEIDKALLYQQIGADEPAGVQLTTKFAVGTPGFTLDSVLRLARVMNPALVSARTREQSAGLQIRATQGQYTPTLSLNTGWGGNAFQYRNSDFLVAQQQAGLAASHASCLTLDSVRVGAGLGAISCGSGTLTPDQQQAIRDENNNFPFKFRRNPFGFSASLSLPVFDGFNREYNVQSAIVAHDNAQIAVRQQEVQTTAAVTQNYLQLMLASNTIGLREQTVEQARQQLQFAEERYRVGQATFLDVITARTAYEQALIDRLNSIYNYHEAFAALEGAVGRPLR